MQCKTPAQLVLSCSVLLHCLFPVHTLHVLLAMKGLTALQPATTLPLSVRKQGCGRRGVKHGQRHSYGILIGDAQGSTPPRPVWLLHKCPTHIINTSVLRSPHVILLVNVKLPVNLSHSIHGNAATRSTPRSVCVIQVVYTARAPYWSRS